MPLEIDDLADVVASAIKAEVAPRDMKIAALEARLAALEQRSAIMPRDGRDAPLVPGPKGDTGAAGPMGLPGTDGAEGRTGPAGATGTNGQDGQSVNMADVEAMVETRVQKAIAVLPVPSTATEQIATNVHGARELVDMLVKEAVVVAVDRMPTPKDGLDGQSVSVADLLPSITVEVQKAVSELPKPRDGQDGASVDAGDVIETVMGLLDARVEKALAAIPTPQDGRSVTLAEVEPLIASAVEKAVAAVPVPKDGVGLSGALLGRAGNLLVTLTDGTVRDVGMVVGRDVDMVEVRSLIVEEVGKLPKPKDGETGAPGRDGTLEGLKMAFDGERTVSFVHKDGTPVEGGVVRFPLVIDRGVYKAGTTYEQGDGVTFGGSFFIAQRQTTGIEKPEDPSGAFRLSVKRGQTPKDGAPGPPGPAGKPGLNGKDWQQKY